MKEILNDQELENISGGSSILPDKFVDGEGIVTRKMCPKCGKYMVIKGKKNVCSDKECGYSENIEQTEE